jgi:hypothetical protein
MKKVNYSLTPAQKDFADTAFKTVAERVHDELLKYEEPGEDREEAVATYAVKLLVNTRGKMKPARVARKTAEYFRLKLKKAEVNA